MLSLLQAYSLFVYAPTIRQQPNLSSFTCKAKGMVENRVNDSNPVIRYVNASCLETCMGPKGPPGGGFLYFSHQADLSTTYMYNQ